ncbi:MAG: DUF5107 domain-containing protein [Calditrichaeota bacterium]|nr:MAG: DUF5107 domain-containing protein [Calditrichota bacterium]
MSCHITDEWTFRGLKTVILENEFIKATVLPDVGAKIHEFIYKPSNRDFMYHHPRVECRTPVFGVNVDNWWSGGMDEAIPTGHPCVYQGEEYPFLGEAWSLPWHYEIQNRGSDQVTAYLRRPLIISPLIVERWITLRQHEMMLRFRHRITNSGNKAFDFIWGLHPGFAVNSDCRIDLPAGAMIIDESVPDDRLGAKGTKYQWPFARDRNGHRVDMRQVPAADADIMEFHYAAELKEGWLSITDARQKQGAALVFPKDVFSAAWLWLVYGGWRGIFTAAVEAWTGYPAKLSEAVANERFSRLDAGASLECESMLLAHCGFVQVDSIDAEGRVTGKQD